jgi:hypothetical protein
MTAWLTSLRDRPIAESERATAMATVTVLLLAAAILLALSRPSRSTTAILATTLGAERRSAHAHTAGANA